MIGSILNQVQQLFGRGFLIAALVPTLLLTAASVVAWQGVDGLRSLATDWVNEGAKENIFTLATTIVALYLVAYITYGVRAGVLRLYQGEWPHTLHKASVFGLRRETQAWARARRRLDEATAGLDVSAWAIEQDFCDAYSDKRLSDEWARDKLAELKSRTHRPGANGTRPQVRDYRLVLTDAHLLQANRQQLSTTLQGSIDELVRDLRRDYRASTDLQILVQRIESVARREWVAAYNEFFSQFPTDERWLRPTRLGTVMNSAESRTLDRYGLQLSAMWPRLVHLPPDVIRSRIDDATIYLDFTVLMSFLSLTFVGVVGASIGYGKNADLLARALLLVLGFVSFWVFYRLGIQAALGLVGQLESVIDLYRLQLLDALSIERPATPGDEKPIWTEMRRFIDQAEIPSDYVRFQHRAAD